MNKNALGRYRLTLLYMPSADLYVDKIDFRRYLSQTECLQCGYPSCGAIIDAIKAGVTKPGDCTFISKNKAYAFEATVRIKSLWPDVPLLTHPRQGFIGLVELNDSRSWFAGSRLRQQRIYGTGSYDSAGDDDMPVLGIIR